MRKDRKYIIYLVLAFLFYVVIKLLSPREHDWTITYHPEDKNPYGAYALGQLIDKVFPGHKIHQGNYTIYEWFDSLNKPVNFLSISTSFEPGDEDVLALLKNLEQGGTAFISAQYFRGLLADTLGLYTSDYFFETEAFGFMNQNDSSNLSFLNPQFSLTQEYIFPRKNIHNYFSEFDSTRTQRVAENDLNLPVTIKVTWGNGKLFLNSTPLAFTNVYLLEGSNHEFVERSLSHLPERETYWTAFYHLGRMEAQTPLRFILTNEPLAWAYYITVLSILLFMIFEAKRKQRIIPIVKPLANTSLEFVSTIGNLYYQENDHKNIAEKRIAFLIEQIRSKYGINAHQPRTETMQTIARKTGNEENDVTQLFKTINHIQAQSQITVGELKDLNKKIDSFAPSPTPPAGGGVRRTEEA